MKNLKMSEKRRKKIYWAKDVFLSKLLRSAIARLLFIRGGILSQDLRVVGNMA